MKINVVILAAGQGSRMNSELPKVLHTVGGKTMLSHVLATATELASAQTCVVIGHGGDQVRASLNQSSAVFVEQSEQKGTGHAVLQALPQLDLDSVALVLYGDVPLLQASTLRSLLDLATQGPALLTAKMSDPSGYGRVVRDQSGRFVSVVEHKDATTEQLALTEINTGVLAIPTTLLNAYLPKVGNQNSQGEYYLPDVLPLAIADGHAVHTVCASDPVETEGVNTREQLARLERIYQHRQVLALMAAGVSFADPQRVDIRGIVRAGKDCFIDINAVFEGEVTLGDGVVIEPNCVIRSSTIGPFTRVCAMSHIEQAEVGAHASVGPFARLRAGTRLADKTKIGNFVETKNAALGVGSKVNHLSYVGDAQIGIDVNIGAGTITCNYDGANKHTTELGDHVFIGSNSTLVAPLSIESHGFVGAGSVVTKTVKQGDLAIARVQQRNISGWKRPKKKD